MKVNVCCLNREELIQPGWISDDRTNKCVMKEMPTRIDTMLIINGIIMWEIIPLND